MLSTGSQMSRARAEAAAVAQDPLHLVGALGFRLCALGTQPDLHLGVVLLALLWTRLR